MDLKFLFLDFDGRINRQPFWLAVIAILIVDVALGVIFRAWLAALLQLLLLYPVFAVAAKRCHDRGKSGWWSLLLLIPLVGLIWAIIDLGILEGTEGENTYGPNPLRGA